MVCSTTMLTDAKIKAVKAGAKDYRLGDSGQLYLQVTKAGGRLWRMNYTYGRNAQGKPKQKTLSFGAYPTVTLSQARAKRDKAKSLLADGLDPAEERRSVEQARETAVRNSFRSVFEEWFELHSGWSMAKLRSWEEANGSGWAKPAAGQWTTDKGARWSTTHAADVLRSMERDVLPTIGDRPVASLTGREVLDVLREVERRGSTETAHRLRQRMSAVFSYGLVLGACDNDPAGGLGAVLKVVPRSKPQPSIIDGCRTQEERLAAVRQMLLDCEALRARAATKLAMRLLTLTAVRPGELAGAHWDEFHDLDGPEPYWRIPSTRMKGTKDRKSDGSEDHVVPLAREAVDVLAALRAETGRYPLCFPGERQVHKPMSSNTLRALLIRAGYFQRHVPHGCRAAFSTIMNERPAAQRQEGDRAVVDLMLAHVPLSRDAGGRSAALVSDSEGAYNRAAYMDRRRELAKEWADMLLTGFCPADTLLGQPMRWAANGPGRPR